MWLSLPIHSGHHGSLTTNIWGGDLDQFWCKYSFVALRHCPIISTNADKLCVIHPRAISQKRLSTSLTERYWWFTHEKSHLYLVPISCLRDFGETWYVTLERSPTVHIIGTLLTPVRQSMCMRSRYLGYRKLDEANYTVVWDTPRLVKIYIIF